MCTPEIYRGRGQQSTIYDCDRDGRAARRDSKHVIVHQIQYEKKHVKIARCIMKCRNKPRKSRVVNMSGSVTAALF